LRQKHHQKVTGYEVRVEGTRLSARRRCLRWCGFIT
jgi:hypothetical protein